MLIQITKRPDGGGVLRCLRPDGSVTWQRQASHLAPHFALHDLTHFAVESTLGFRRAFFGLIADGWGVDDTTGKGSRGPLPEEAVEAEHLVGWLDAERAGGTIWPADEFTGAFRKLTDDDLVRVRARRSELFSEWSAIEPGGTLELKWS
jgi:hypothetical protein